MRVEITSPLPIEEKHGLHVGRVLTTVEPEAEFVDRTLDSEVWVQADAGEKVKLFPREYTITNKPESKQMYLVTDPCYVVADDEWSDYCDAIYGGGGRNASDWQIEGVGRIIQVDNTSYGDGEWNVAKGKSVMADAGLVCIVELKRGYEPTNYQGTAITDSLSTAQDWFDFVTTSEDSNIEDWDN